MSLCGILKVKHWLASTLEIILFAGISVLLLWGIPALFDKLAGGFAAWGWAVLCLGYLLLLTIWWVPLDEELNRAEVTGLALVGAIALVAGAGWVEWQYHGLSNAAHTIWTIVVHNFQKPA